MLVDRAGLTDRWRDESRGAKSLNKNSASRERHHHIRRLRAELGLNPPGGKLFELDGSGLVGYKVETWTRSRCRPPLWNVSASGPTSRTSRGTQATPKRPWQLFRDVMRLKGVADKTQAAIGQKFNATTFRPSFLAS